MLYGAQAGIARKPFGRDPVVDRLAEGGSHIGIVDGLRAIEHVADRVTGAELVERPALHHRQVAAGFSLGRPPVGPAGQRHIGRIAGEIEAIDGPAHHLLLPVIVEIGQQRGARSAHGGMDIAVDPRGRHAHSLKYRFWRLFAAYSNVPPPASPRKGQAAEQTGYFGGISKSAMPSNRQKCGSRLDP
jgi:hypothetical protein